MEFPARENAAPNAQRKAFAKRTEKRSQSEPKRVRKANRNAFVKRTEDRIKTGPPGTPPKKEQGGVEFALTGKISALESAACFAKCRKQNVNNHRDPTNEGTLSSPHRSRAGYTTAQSADLQSKGKALITTFGRHLVVEYHGCDPAVLDNAELLREVMEAAALNAQASIVQTVVHRFTPQGASVVVVVEESHLSIHTWPEVGYAAVDFYTCGECDPIRAHEVLSERLKAEESEIVVLHRGLQTEATSIMQVEKRIERAEDTDVDFNRNKVAGRVS